MFSCGHCEGTGFLNLHQIPDDEQPGKDDDFHEFVLAWIESHEEHDVQVCGCCEGSECPGYHSDNEKQVECL